MEEGNSAANAGAQI